MVYSLKDEQKLQMSGNEVLLIIFGLQNGEII
jgi:hypothetical protein